MEERSPTWSPDGEWLAFRSSSGSEGRLLKVRVGSAGPVEEIAATCQVRTMPEWSPTGEWIASVDAGCGTMLVSPTERPRARSARWRSSLGARWQNAVSRGPG